MPKYLFNYYNSVTATPPAALVIVTSSLATAVVGVPYSVTLEATGGTLPYSWSRVIPNDVLPVGMNFNTATGVLSGTPTTPGTHSLQFSVTDATTTTRATTGVFNFTVNAASTLTVTTSSVPNGKRGVSYTTTAITATGGTTPYTWSLVPPSNVVPAGMTFNTSTVQLSGTPTVAGTYPLLFRVTDSVSAEDDSGSFSLIVNEVDAILITSGTTLTRGEATVAYSYTFQTSGGWGTKTWEFIGTLPTGLNFNTTTGVLSGTPTAAATYTFSIKVTDSEARTSTKPFSLQVVAFGTAVGAHDFFLEMRGRADHLVSYSWRDADYLVAANLSDDSLIQGTSYDPANDTDPFKQDGTKCVVPMYEYLFKGTLTAAVDATTLSFPISGTMNSTNYPKNTEFKYENEIVRLANVPFTGTNLNLSGRGLFGTTAAPHALGVKANRATNKLRNQIRSKLDLTPGHTYLVMWDSYWTNSWLRCGIGTYKAFQISRSGSIFFEPQYRFGGNPGGGNTVPAGYDHDLHIGVATARSYATGYTLPVTDINPISPMDPTFILYPNRWTRHYIKIEYNVSPSTQCVFSMWVSDEVQAPRLIIDSLPLGTATVLDLLYVELDTSTNEWPVGRTTAQAHLGLAAFRDLVTYVRNLVALKNPTDIPGVLRKPIGS